MPTEIDSLSISINAKAQTANRQIDALVGRLDVLSKSLGKLNGGSTNLVGLANGVERLGRAMQSMNAVKTADFTRLASNLTKLGSINVSTLNSTASSLTHLTRSFNGLGKVSQNAVQVGEMAKNLAKLGNKSVDKAIENLPRLAIGVKNLMTTLSKAPTVSANVIQMTQALANLASQGSKVGSASNSINRSLASTVKTTTVARASFGGLASAIGKFYATYFLAIRGLKALWKSINSTADYVEAFNYYTVSLGKVASKWDENWGNYADESARNYANKFVTTLNSTFNKLSGVSYDPKTGLLSETGLKNLGLNLQQVTQYAAQLSSMMDAVGQSGETTLATTNAFVKLAGDISSLYNIDYQNAADKIRSVLQGQSRAGYGFGWDTTMAALQATADKFSVAKPVSEMSQMEKQQLRILTILEQSRVAWGDQSNTINTLANQIRIFKNSMGEAGMMLGQLFVPILTRLMPVINGITIAIKRLLGSLAGLLGIEIKDVGQGFSDMSDELGGIEDAYDSATDAAKKFKTYTLGIDELNIQPQQDESSGAKTGDFGGGIDLTNEIENATEEYERVWQEAFDKTENRAEKFAQKLEKIFKPITEPLKKLFKDIAIGDWFSAGQDTSQIAIGLFDLLSKAVDSVNWEQVGKNIGNFIAGIDWIKAFSALGNLAGTIIEAIFDVWKGSLKTAPIETALVTAFGLLSYTGVAGAMWGKIATALSATVSGSSIGLVPTIAIGAITWVIGFDVGKSLGKALFPDDAVYYDEFKFFGDGGFFKTITEDIETTIKAYSDLSTDFKNNPIGAILATSTLGSVVKLKKPLIDTIEEIFERAGFVVQDWYIDKVAPWFTKEKWEELFNVVGTSFQTTTDFIVLYWAEEIEEWWSDNVAPWFTVDKWQKMLQNILIAFANKWKELSSWWKASTLVVWWGNDVAPWFTIERWQNMLHNILIAFTSKWTQLKNWWSTSTLNVWWSNNVAPWFTYEKWFNLYDTIRSALVSKWSIFTDWWGKSGVGTWYENNVKPWFQPVKWAFGGIQIGLTTAFNSAFDAIKQIWNRFADWMNSMLTWDIEPIEINGKKIFEGKTISLGKLPKFQTGGFPEDGLFMANHNELVGQFSNGRTAVANNEMIVEGIEGGVERAVARVLAPYLADIAQNTRETANKDLSVNIGDRDIARANARGSRSMGYALIT